MSGSADNTIKLWNIQSGKLVRTFKGHTGDVKSVTFSPDGKQVAFIGSYRLPSHVVAEAADETVSAAAPTPSAAVPTRNSLLSIAILLQIKV